MSNTSNGDKQTYRTEDKPSKVSFSGMLGVIALIGAMIVTFMILAKLGVPLLICAAIATIMPLAFLTPGFYILNPNESAVIIFFGKYKGTDRVNGWRWIPPFHHKRTKSFKIHNFESDVLKVNDLNGNPIEFAAIVSYRIKSPAQAEFDVDAEDFSKFIEKQSETALRKTVGAYPYDNSNDNEESEEITLRGNSEEVSRLLHSEVQARLSDAGIDVLGVEISHLAYATEIAQAMLQRQQATALISARKTIVEGSVTIIQATLKKLSDENIGTLSDSDKNQIISNMLLILAGDSNAQPVINTQQSKN